MNESDLRLLVASLFWLTIPSFLLQLGAAAYLPWRAIWRWRPDALGEQWPARWLTILGVYMAPIPMLILSTQFHGGYQGERGGHWFFHSHSGLVGIMMVPVFAAGSIRAAVAFANRSYLTSGLDQVILITLAVICGWYAFATAFLGMNDDYSGDMSILAIVPALAAINYGLVAIDAGRHRRLQQPGALGLFVWFGTLVAFMAARIPFAKRFYDALPPQPPAGYGDCFVVSAAARGHPGFVGSRLDTRSGIRVNRQLLRLWNFERRLRARYPAAHRRLRRFYDIVGPAVAGQIRSPLVADIVYVALKPLEWLSLSLCRR